MWFQIITIIILVLIVISLFSALASLVRNKSASGKTVKMLGYRVAFSFLLLLFLAFAKFTGLTQPHDLKGQPVSQPMISAPAPSGADNARPAGDVDAPGN
jgi:Na+/H+-dicarboxylate symporter